MNLSEKKPQCLICKHNTKKSSCGPCADKGTIILKGIIKAIACEVEILERTLHKLKSF